MSIEDKKSEEQVAKHLRELSNWNGQFPEASQISNPVEVMFEPTTPVHVPLNRYLMEGQIWAVIQEMIYKMNQTYNLPCNFNKPDLKLTPDNFYVRMQQFQATLGNEFAELQDIRDTGHTTSLEALTDLSDLLGDIIVYCLSEAARFGIPLVQVLSIIMESNMSKLGEDGKALKDENDKFLKGPNYWKPEPKIRELLIRKAQENKDELSTSR